MRVLAVDPGYDRIGIAILSDDTHPESVMYSECFTTDKNDSLPHRLAAIATHIHTCIPEYTPDALAIETLWFNVNKTTALNVAHARGIILAAAAQHGLHIAEYSPQAIKIAVTGHGNSDKKQVTDMVKRIVKNAPPHGFDDEYDAIAVGITHIAHAKTAVM